MFNKEEYWKRRNNIIELELPDPKSKAKKPKTIKVEMKKPLRGQIEVETTKFYPKGEPVLVGGKDINALGINRRFDKRGKMIVQNRKEYRQKSRSHVYTQKGEDHKQFSAQTFYTLKEIKDLKLPMWRIKLPKDWEPPMPSKPSLSNHDAHRLRQIQRHDKQLKTAVGDKGGQV